MKLVKKIVYTGDILLKTGLHIGGTNAALNIGGPDKFVVRNPINSKPYIPGSSLKGKMRSLIELYYGETKNGGPSDDYNSHSGALFGLSPNNNDGKNSGKHASRLIVRDAELDEESCDFSHTDLLYTESKTEVSIDRVTSKANPRTFERVPAGAKFKMNLVLNIFEPTEPDEKVGKYDNEKALTDILDKAMQLLADDYLGGQGSRGYGQIEFQNVKKEEK